MCLPSTKLNLNDKSDRPHWKIKLTLHDLCFDHNIWWEKFQIFENLPHKGKKTHLKLFPTKLWSQIRFAVYFQREKTSKLDSAHKECPAASKLCTLWGCWRSDGRRREHPLLECCSPSRGWTGRDPQRGSEPRAWPAAIQPLKAQTSHGKVSF